MSISQQNAFNIRFEKVWQKRVCITTRTHEQGFLYNYKPTQLVLRSMYRDLKCSDLPLQKWNLIPAAFGKNVNIIMGTKRFLSVYYASLRTHIQIWFSNSRVVCIVFYKDRPTSLQYTKKYTVCRSLQYTKKQASRQQKVLLTSLAHTNQQKVFTSKSMTVKSLKHLLECASFVVQNKPQNSFSFMI